MNFLFLSHKYPKEKENSCLEKDFIKKLSEKGHKVYVITTTERRMNEKTHIYKDGNIEVLYVKTGNRTKKYNLVEKIVTILTTPYFIKVAFNKYFKDIKIDYTVTYTPFMSSLSLIKFFKKKLNCKIILFLWDIMPQTAKDMGIIKNEFIFKYMKNNEKKMYLNIDKVICNCTEAENYILSNKYKTKENIIFIRNPEYISKFSLSQNERRRLREKYGYTEKDIVFIFGGNMGMLQKLENVLELAKIIKKENPNIKFILIGDGKDKNILEEKVKNENIDNVQILNVIPRYEYENTIGAFDCGLISLNEKNTVPNFPTKVTAYLKLGLPIFASLDSSAAKGIGRYIDENNIGVWGKAGDTKNLKEKFDLFMDKYNNNFFGKDKLKNLYEKDFDIEKAYNIIMRNIGEENER